MSQIKRLLLFTGGMALFCAVYVLIAPPQPPLPHGSWRKEGGELLGGAVVWLFVIIYGRTGLKLLLRQGPLLERLLPDGVLATTTPWGKGLLTFLNKMHPYVGIAAVLLVGGHALIEGWNQVNLLLLVVLALSLWQFGCGLFLLSRYQAVFVKKLKRYGYLAHSQLYTGIALGLAALFGHLLVKG